MIVRARPKYLTSEMIDLHANEDDSVSSRANCLYFNYGRTALQFLLKELKKYYKKPLVVGIQSFNCEVVVEATIDSGNEVLFMDIEKEFFSISLTSLQRIGDKIDVLILTHYQGIPNPYYLEIVAYCQQSEIFMIEDCAQTEKSSIAGKVVGTLSSAKLESYSFDKPHTTYEGGALILNESLPVKFREKLLSSYAKLPIESNRKIIADLKTLKWLLINTTTIKYHKYLPYSKIHRLIYCNVPSFIISIIYARNPFSSITRRLVNYMSPRDMILAKPIERMGAQKIKLLEKQGEWFADDQDVWQQWERIASSLGLTTGFAKEMCIHWNRYSVLDDTDGSLKSFCKGIGVEAENYNWPQPMHEKYRERSECHLEGTYENTVFCCIYIVNLPCWTNLNKILQNTSKPKIT